MVLTQEYFVAISSEDRDSGTISKYTVSLPSLIERVVRIEYVSGEIPNTLYVSNMRYVFFRLTDALDDPFYFTVPVLPGIWKSNELLNHMTENIFFTPTYLETNERLNDMNNPTVVFTFDEHTSKFGLVIRYPGVYKDPRIIEGTDTFFGFIPDEDRILPHHAVLTNTYYAEHVCMTKVPSYLYLCLDEIGDFPCSDFMTSYNPKKVIPLNIIARIQMNADILHVVNSSPNTFDFSRPLNPRNPMNISRLSLSFRGPDGNVVDFKGVEHSLLLKLTTINR